MKKRVTLVDIAKATGYSVNSVSRALMDASDISEATKTKIINKANELGYIPNLNAASLKKGNSKIIGILYDDLLNPYFNTIIYYLEKILSAKDYTFIIYRSREFDINVFNHIVSRNLEGLISFLTPNREVVKRISNNFLPMVMIGRKSDYISSVYADEKAIGCLAAKAIIEANYKHPIYIGETEKIDISKDRAMGFFEEMKRNDIDCRLYFCEEQEKLPEVLTSAINDGSVDSIFCFSDFLAFKAMSYLSKKGMNDICIVGVDNIREEIPFPFPIWSIGQNKEKIASDAIELLFKQINSVVNAIEFIVEDIYLVKEIY